MVVTLVPPVPPLIGICPRGTTARLRIPRKSSAQRHARGILYCMVPGSAPKLLAQMRRGAIEFCVLALLRDGDTYGLDLARTLAADGLVTGEGTIYPLLSRLRQEGMVETSWHESPQGPPRRYYRLTEDGRAALDAFIVHWRQFRDAVDVVLEGDQSL